MPSGVKKSMGGSSGGSSGGGSAGEARLAYLLDVAAKTFLENGFERTTVGEIARRARASKETFYNRFSTKDELFRAVIRHLMDRFASQQQAILNFDEAPRTVLPLFAKVMLDRFLSDEGLRLQNIVHVESVRFPDIGRMFFELGPQRTMASLANYFLTQVEKGNLRKLDARLAASQFVSLIVADLAIRRSLRISPMPTAGEKERYTSAAVDVFLHGYGSGRATPSSKRRNEPLEAKS